MDIIRGGQPSLEKEHGKLLLSGNTSERWGWGTPAGKLRVQRRVDWITSTCHLAPGVNALECGCGLGIFTQELVKTGASITAFDISPDLLNEAKNKCQVKNVNFIEGNLESPSVLPDNFFDVLYGVSVLHHLSVKKALNALRNKLKPGARFAFSEPNMCNPINKHFMFIDDQKKRQQRGLSPTEMAFYATELSQYFEESGYTVESIAYRDFLLPSIPVWSIPLVNTIGHIAETLPFIKKWSGSLWISGRCQK